MVPVAQFVIDMPEIAELDINPLLVDERAVVALDARIEVATTEQRGAACYPTVPQAIGGNGAD